MAPSPETVERLELAWTHRTGVPVGQPVVHAGPVMRRPFVYVVSDEALWALELSTGKVRWKAKAGAGMPSDGTQPVAHGGLIVRLNQTGVLRRYVPRSGHIVWQRTVPFENYAQRQIVADGLWFMLVDWTLFAYDAATGRERWTRGFDCGNCSPASADGRLYVAGLDQAEEDGKGGRLYALDTATGKTIWSSGTDAEYTIGASPAVADGRVFVRTMSGGVGARAFSIEAFRTSDGTHLWHGSVGTAEGFWFTPLAADAAVVVYPSEDGSLHTLDARTGTELWKASGTNNRVRPVIVNGIVWAGDDAGRIVAYDARDGRRLWASPRFEPDGPGSPVIAGDTLLFCTTDGRLLAFRVPS